MRGLAKQSDVQAYRLKALAHPVRLHIVQLLWVNGHSLPAGVLQQHLPVELSAHLTVLRAKGIVDVRGQGADRVYTLADVAIGECVSLLLEVSDE